MRFLMRNCLKYAQQCQNGNLRKRVGQERYPIQISPRYFVNIGSMGNPLTPDAEFKNRYIRPKKINYMFLRHRPRHLQTPRIKNFYCISSIHIEKSSKHRELSV